MDRAPSYGVLTAFPILPGEDGDVVLSIDGVDFGVKEANPHNIEHASGLFLPSPIFRMTPRPTGNVYASAPNLNGDIFPNAHLGSFAAISMGTHAKWEKAEPEHPAVRLRSEILRAVKNGMSLDGVREIVDMMSIEQVMDE